MSLHRLGFVLCAATAAVSAGAVGGCGGGEESITPTGPHYQYVMNRILVPANPTQVEQYGLDLNGDGSIDNTIGKALNFLSGLGFDVQAAVDTSVLGGKLSALVDLQTSDFNSAPAVGIEFFLGDTPQPTPCNAGEVVICTGSKPAECKGCGRHLATNGSFSIAASSPQDGPITGKIVGGTFNGKGKMTLLISLGDAAPIRFDLIGAKVKATGISEASIGNGSGATLSDGFVLAGGVAKEDIDNTVIPGIVAQVEATVRRDCKTPSAPDCGCPDGAGATVGRKILGVLDKAPADCSISLAEVAKVATPVLQSDLTIDGKPATSAGIKATATKTTFTVPGQ